VVAVSLKKKKKQKTRRKMARTASKVKQGQMKTAEPETAGGKK